MALPFWWYDEDTKLSFPHYLTKQRLASLQLFTVRPEDVFITTLVRSGTHWVSHIVKLICNNGEPYEGPIFEAVPLWESEGTDFQAMASPRLFKSHFPYAMMPGGLPHTTQAKYIYVARNPKDVIVSCYHFVRSFQEHQYQGSVSEFIDAFLSQERFCYGGWFHNVLSWWEHRDKPNVLFLKYEDIKKDLAGTIKSIALFLGYEISLDTLQKITEMSTFESMKTQSSFNFSGKYTLHPMDPNGAPLLRKGQVGDWKTFFTQEQSDYFDAEYAKRMKDTGLQFDFE